MADFVSGHQLGKLAVVAAPGLALASMIYVTDKISAAYFNPAIPLGIAIWKIREG